MSKKTSKTLTRVEREHQRDRRMLKKIARQAGTNLKDLTDAMNALQYIVLPIGPARCRHDFTGVNLVANRFAINPKSLRNALRDHGGFCDCEAILNVIFG